MNKWVVSPARAATLLGGLFVIPVFWIFAIQGVTTTTSFDFSTGETSSSSDFASQFGKALVFFAIAGALIGAGKIMERNQTPWPPPIEEQLVRLGFTTSTKGPQAAPPQPLEGPANPAAGPDAPTAPPQPLP